MRVNQLIQDLGLKILAENDGLESNCTGCFTGDLLSVVMSKAKPENVWITIQGHLNIVAVASFCEIPLIIVAEGFELEEGVALKANDESIVIASTPLSAYEIAIQISKVL